jgi:hypothetical protein
MFLHSMSGGLERALAVAAALLALLLLAGPADARAGRKKAIWGPAEVNGKSQFPIYRDLGARIYEAGLSWAAVAPTRPRKPKDPRDPAYRWPSYLDYAVKEARRYHMRVALNVTHAPRWANGGRSREWAPRRPRDYARFVTAAARRYRSVRLWIIWGEPSRKQNFKPLPRFESTGPRRYARILDAAYSALKRVRRRNLAVGGNTFTTGDIPALAYLKAMRLPGGRRPRFDLYGHNPFTRRRPRLSDPPLGFGFVDFGTLDTLVRRLDRYYPRRRGRRRIKLFLEEFTVPTGHRDHQFNFFVSESTAASWLTSALRITRRWRRIYALGWFTLYDEAPRPKGDESLLGLIARNGRRKPAYYAYRDG